MVERVYIVIGFTRRLIQGARQYVTDTSWFDDQADALRLWLTLLEMALGNVRLEDGQQPIECE